MNPHNDIVSEPSAASTQMAPAGKKADRSRKPRKKRAESPAETNTVAKHLIKIANLAPPPPKTSEESRRAATELALSSGRRVDIPVRKGFVRSFDEDTAPPMSQIYAGGRSGIVAIKLLLALIWRCGGYPFTTDKPTRAWATLLDLSDPAGNGSRRISAALRTLSQAKLITTSEQAGRPNLIMLANETGTGEEYTLPSTAYQFAKTQEDEARNLYFKIPPHLWTSGEIQALSGPATVMLLILLSERADQEDVWWSTTQFPKRYHISHKTRADGTRELIERRLLVTRRESLSLRSPQSIFDDRRRRTVYRVFFEPNTAESFFWQAGLDGDDSRIGLIPK